MSYEGYRPPEWYERPASLVEDQIDKMWVAAANSLRVAEEVLAGLGDFELDPIPPAPDITLTNEQGSIFGTPTAPSRTLFGTVDDFVTPAMGDPDAYLVGLDDPIDEPPAFLPSITGLNIPAAPSPIVIGALPDRPVLDGVVIPVSPDVVIPDLPVLSAITVPTFTFLDLPTFDATAPEFEGSAPTIVLNWAEPTYESELFNELLAKVRLMMAGGTGIPAEIESAMFDRARGREDGQTVKMIQEVTTDWAARGFEHPPGMLAAQVQNIRDDSALKISAFNREILVQSATWEIENLRFAVQQGMALEGQLVSIFNNAATRSFEAAKFQLESMLSFYNAQVSLFNARQSAYTAAVQVFEAKLKAELSKIDIFRAEVDGQKAIGELNSQLVAVYEAQVRTVATRIEVYKAQMEGAKVQSEMGRYQLEMYKADISAYAEQLQADKVRFEAYESQVKGESAKAGILESETRAYAATIQAFESKNNIKIQKLKARTDANQAVISEFIALVEAQKAKILGQTSAIQAEAGAYTADVGRFTAEIQGMTAEKELETRMIEARLRNNLALFEVRIKEYDATMARVIQIANLKIEAMRAAGQIASSIASGAMSAMHVGATLSGSGSLQGSDSLSINKTYSYEG